jgi:hypothetical protein
MKSMVRGWDRKALGLVLATLMLAIGFCVFHGDGHHGSDHAGLDLCLGMLAAFATVTLACRLPLVGSAAADRLASILELSLRVPAPPPKAELS